MEATRFSLTYDYRCPFARNAHDHVVTALKAQAPFEVDFSPFVLGSAYAQGGAPTIWEDPEQRKTLTALAASIFVRDRLPEKFLDVHRALFNLRHDDGGDLRDDTQVRSAIESAGVDPNVVYDGLAEGWPFAVVRREHEIAVIEHEVFGVPTFIANGEAAFVRLMTRPEGDPKLAVSTIETVLTLLHDHVEINEFKHTSIPH